MYFLLGNIDDKFVGSDLYNVMVFSLIPTFIYLVLYFIFIRTSVVRPKWIKPLGLCGIPLAYFVSFLIVWCVFAYWHSMHNDMDIIADQIASNRSNASLVRYLVPAIWLLGYLAFILAVYNAFNNKKTFSQIAFLIGVFVLAAICLVWFLLAAPEVSKLITLRFFVKEYALSWVLGFVAVVSFCRTPKEYNSKI